MDKTKIALIGIGGYARLYVNYLLDHLDRNDYEITAVADPNPSGCQRLAELQVVCNRFYACAEDLFQQETVDLTVISTPIQFHADNIITALQSGSHVLCEKPMCADPQDIQRILQARNTTSKFVMVGYQWSFNSSILQMKQDILDGIYGKLLHCKALAFMGRDFAYFQRNGWAGKQQTPKGKWIRDSIANNAAAHYLHNLLFLCGDTLETAAEAKNISARLYRANDIETFDTILSNATCAGDVKLDFLATHAAAIQKQMRFDLEFTGGRISYVGGETPGQILGYVAGEESPRCYGNPDLAGYRKLEIAMENTRKANPFVPCGIETAAAQVRFIEAIQQYPVETFPAQRYRQRTQSPGIYIDGLDKELESLYNR